MPESTRVGRAMVNVLGRAALVLFALLFVFAFVAMACLAGCAVTTIEGDLKAGTFKVSSPKDGSLKGLEIDTDPVTGRISLKLKSADYDATNPARVQVDAMGAVAEGVAAGLAKGVKP